MSSTEGDDSYSVDQSSTNEDNVRENSQFNSETELVSDSESDIDLEEDSANIVNEINEELQRGIYTCLVCTGEIDSSSPVWSCHICCRVYDLQCIKDWAKKGSSTDSIDRSWKCPSCNGKHFKIPNKYTCWCGKVINPPKNNHQPHSCGQTCNHKLKQCVHNCSFTCHPGPHIRQCTALGPKMLCNCGEFEQQLPCVLTPYNQGWKCPNACNDLLNCGLHHCKEQCHKGLCHECNEILENVNCYCGKQKKDIYCNDKSIIKSTTLNDYIGLFSCDETCNELLSCGNHRCEMVCHIKEDETYSKEKSFHKCPLSPELVDKCCCGNTTLEELGINRESCTDPIPTCDKLCNKTLPCGHKCYWKCHEGDECSPCYKPIDKKCSCGNMTYSVPCPMDQDGFIPKCETKCLSLLNCRRHRCNLICCEYQHVAMQRERDRKKELRRSAYNSTNDNDSMTIEAIHICTKDCNKLLSCGKHNCQMTCHLGPCRPCLESSSEDLICHCGKTKLEAPVRCGSKLPPCLNQCQRPYSCGHESMPHFCHEDDIKCPRCTKLVTKKCKCHREIMVPKTLCYLENGNCGLKCGKLLSCQLHKCEKICHKEGECPTKCLSKCGKLRSCGHICTQICHSNTPCPENISCNEKVKISCECGRLVKEVMCFNKAQIDKLKCDDECARVKRNKLLFEAFNVNHNTNNEVPPPDNDVSDYISLLSLVDTLYTDYVIETYKKQKTWCSQVEDKLLDLIRNQTSTKGFNFPSMKQPQRRFIHELSESLKLYSESQDKEPNRSVFVKVTNSSTIPKLTIQEAIMILEKKRQAELMKLQQKKLILTSKLKEEEESDNANLQFFNSIVIKDIFFGTTLTMIQECILPVYKKITGKEEEEEECTVQYIDSSTYIFYTKDYKTRTEELDTELRNLKDIFLEELKNKNLAYSCLLGKIDETASVVYEIESVKKDEVKALTSGNFDSQWW